jgi:hypothetical protein
MVRTHSAPSAATTHGKPAVLEAERGYLVAVGDAKQQVAAPYPAKTVAPHIRRRYRARNHTFLEAVGKATATGKQKTTKKESSPI